MQPTTAPLRVAVVGLNERIERQVLPGIAASPRARITAVCSRDAGKAERFAAPYGCRPFCSLRELLGSDEVDAVFVMTPADQHAEMSLAALEAGKAVMCEKPLASTLAEAEAMAAEARERGLRTAVNFTYRSVTGPRLFAESVAERGVGRLLHAEAAYWQARAITRPAQRVGNVLFELGSHVVDALLWWCELSGAADPRVVGAARDRDELTWSVLLRFGDGATGLLRTSKVALGHSNAIEARLYGSEGALRLDFDTEGYEVASFGPAEPPQKRRVEARPEIALDYRTFPAYHWDRLVGALRGEERFPDFEQGLRVQRLMDEAVRLAV